MAANTRQHRRFNPVGRLLTLRLIPTSDNTNPVSHFLASVNDLIEHAFRDVEDSDMVGMTNQNHVNQNDKPTGISCRRKDQLSAEVTWSGLKNSPIRILDTMPWTRYS